MRTLRALAVLMTALAVLTALPGWSAAAPGDPDRGFSGNGWVQIDITHTDNQSASDVATDPRNGDVVVLANTGGGLSVIRFTPDGKLDESFGGGDGIARFRSPEDWLIATTLDVGADGRTLVGGTSGAKDLTGEFVYRRFLVRFDATGIRDPSFGADGVLLSLTSSYGYTDVQQIGSKIVASGRSCEGCPEEGLVWRLLEDGSPDPTFSGDGEARLDRAMPFGLDKVGVDDRGRVTAVGWIGSLWGKSLAHRPLPSRRRPRREILRQRRGVEEPGDRLELGPRVRPTSRRRWLVDRGVDSNEALTVVHRRPSCILDARFSSDGVATPSLPTYPKSVQVDAARILARGRVVLAGYTEFGSRAFHPMVARLTVAGRLDRSFGRKGISVLPLADAWFTSVTADARGRPIAGGLAYDPEDGLLIRILWRASAHKFRRLERGITRLCFLQSRMGSRLPIREGWAASSWF